MSQPLFQSVSALVNTAGTAEVVLSPQIGTTYEVSQVSVQGTADPAGPGASADIFYNSLFVCASSNGAQDVASDDPTITLYGSDQMQVAWAGMLPGSQCTALFQGTLTPPGG